MRAARLTTTLLALFALLSLAGCKKEPTCEVLLEKMVSCEGDKKPSDDDKKAFTEMCKEQQAMDAKAFEPVLACAAVDSCEAAEECYKKASKDFRKATAHVKITKALAEKKDVDKHKYLCEDVVSGKEEGASDALKAACKDVMAYLEAEEVALIKADITAKKFKDSKKKYDCERVLTGEEKGAGEGLKAACKEFYTAWTGELSGAITKERDAATADTKRFSECYEFEKASKALGGEEGEKKAKAMCEEHGLAIDVAKTLQDVDKVIAEKKSSGAYSCDRTLEALDKFGSEFAKAKREVVFNKCNIEFGKHILETELPKISQYTCPFQIKDFLKKADTLGLAGKDPKLDELMATARADEKCTK